MRSAVKTTGKVGSYMKIQDFCDMDKFEQIMKNWASSTGLATVAVGADGKYISGCYNFTEFCIDLTRGSAEGKSAANSVTEKVMAYIPVMRDLWISVFRSHWRMEPCWAVLSEDRCCRRIRMRRSSVRQQENLALMRINISRP